MMLFKIELNIAKIKIDSYDSLSIEKDWPCIDFENVIIHIKSVLNKDRIHHTVRFSGKVLLSIS